MTNKAFTVDEKVIVASMASAVRQDELLSIVANPMGQAFIIAAQSGSEVPLKTIALRLMTFPPEEKAKLVDILTEKAVLQGTSIRVSPKDFQGKMVSWNMLLAQLLEWNLADFFELMRSDLAQSVEKEKVAKEAEAQ